MAEINKQWGMALSGTQFACRKAEIQALQEGEILIRDVYFFCDPMNHAWVKRGWASVFPPSRSAVPCGVKQQDEWWRAPAKFLWL